MDVKRLPWVPGLLQDLGLEDLGGGFWSSPDRSRSLYLGLGSVMIFTVVEGAPDFETQHVYPSQPDEVWLMDAVADHAEALVWHAQESDPRWN